MALKVPLLFERYVNSKDNQTSLLVTNAPCSLRDM